MPKKEKTEGEGRALRGSNFEPEITKGFVDRLERLNDDIQAEKDLCKEQCIPIKADIAEVMDEAEEAGIPPDLLKGALKRRKLQRQAEKVEDKFLGMRKDQYHALLMSLGELGQAALDKAA